MKLEFHVLENNKTWTLVSLSLGHKPIGCKRFYKIIYHFDGTTKCYKARLIAKGYIRVRRLTIMRLSHQHLCLLLFVVCLLLLLPEIGLSIKLMSKMPFSMRIYMRKCIRNNLLVFAAYRERMWGVSSINPIWPQTSIMKLVFHLFRHHSEC